MQDTTITLHSRFQIGPVDPRIFGGFLEHMGRAVYEGVYDPDCACADKDGFRTDVLQALDRLKMTVMRYPGGNFASGYHWMDGVGSREQRPTVRELAWQSIEPNQVGTDEYIRLCQKMKWTPMLTVNLGTGTPEEARNWVEYCNSPTGTRYADWRAANGTPAPHSVRLWCLGNEMDGPWQLGHVPADQYAIRAQQAAKMMRDVDGSIELVACGSCTPDLPTYIEWDRQVLEYVGDLADYISLHRYVGNPNDDTPDYLALTNSIDRQIEEMDAVCRFVQAKARRSSRRSNKRAYLCFDEWNVWYRARRGTTEYEIASTGLEEHYNFEDALAMGMFLNSFIRHAHIVKMANLAQLVNVIAPIFTNQEGLYLQPIYFPLVEYGKQRTNQSLDVQVSRPMYRIGRREPLCYLDVSATYDAKEKAVYLNVLNRSEKRDIGTRINNVSGAVGAQAGVWEMNHPDLKATHTFGDDRKVRPTVRKAELKVVDNGFT